MSNISDKFKNKNVIIGFIMAGDPDLKTTKDCILSMAKAGADMVELGIPFSDPIAESTVIQNANIRALKSETYLNSIFEMIEEMRKESNISVIFHSYINPIFNFGYQNFFKKCKEANVEGVLIPDLPFEEKDEIKSFAEESSVNIISFVVPSPKERVIEITKDATGFIYFVPSIGSTSEMGDNSKELTSIIETIKQTKDIPVAIGFGINTVQQAEYFSKMADGIIIGNALVKIIEKYKEESPEHIYTYIKEMKNA